MSNRITNERISREQCCHMGNGLTEIVIDTLAIVVALDANSLWESKLAHWLCLRDQNRGFGRGTVGFDLSELGWTYEEFEEQKAFLLRVLDNGIENGPRLLGHPVHEEWLRDSLSTLKSMVETCTEAVIVPLVPADEAYDENGELDLYEWTVPSLPQTGRCAIHGCFLNDDGCIVCHTFE